MPSPIRHLMISCYVKYPKFPCVVDTGSTIYLLPFKFATPFNAKIKYIRSIFIEQAKGNLKVNKICNCLWK